MVNKKLKLLQKIIRENVDPTYSEVILPDGDVEIVFDDHSWKQFVDNFDVIRRQYRKERNELEL